MGKFPEKCANTLYSLVPKCPPQYYCIIVNATQVMMSVVFGYVHVRPPEWACMKFMNSCVAALPMSCTHIAHSASPTTDV